MSVLKNKHLIGLEHTTANDMQLIIDAGFTFREVLDRPIKKVPALTGKNIVNLFFENSTRTRISFELAEKRLSADVTNFSSSSSSVNKGEGLKDTIQNIHAMKMDCVVLRHPSPGSCLQLSKYVDSSIINAGDGNHEHPTQALLDMMSLQEKLVTSAERRFSANSNDIRVRVEFSKNRFTIFFPIRDGTFFMGRSKTSRNVKPVSIRS